jgi:hypothetical protein
MTVLRGVDLASYKRANGDGKGVEGQLAGLAGDEGT